MKNDIRLKSGKLSSYGFSCGYQEIKEGVRMYKEFSTYHVQGFDFNDNRIWRSFDNVKEARKFFNAVVKTNKLNK